MSTEIVTRTATESQGAAPFEPYEHGPTHLFGTNAGLFERHLLYDNVIGRTVADARDRYEAFARAVRDLLSKRWVSTGNTYSRLTPSVCTISRWSS